ncbi:MAG: DUF2461 domain-containing protein [Bacteroidota bacterium]
MSQINAATFQFLTELKHNNNRDWFAEHKPRYEAARGNMAAFAQELLDRLSETDVLETASGKKSLFRIYRDVRFSKNKDPYKTSLSGHFVRDGKLRRGGYYFHFAPGDMVVGGGFYGIEKDDLKRIREEIAMDAAPLREIMAAPDFVNTFGEMRGEKLKTAPKGFDREHPDIDLLRYKQFYAFREFTEEEVIAPDFIEAAHATMQQLRPFFDYFSDVLTTNLNGEVIV